jgi:aspartokinase-like uncharacterized kinase
VGSKSCLNVIATRTGSIMGNLLRESVRNLQESKAVLLGEENSILLSEDELAHSWEERNMRPSSAGVVA